MSPIFPSLILFFFSLSLSLWLSIFLSQFLVFSRSFLFSYFPVLFFFFPFVFSFFFLLVCFKRKARQEIVANRLKVDLKIPHSLFSFHHSYNIIDVVKKQTTNKNTIV